VTERGVIHADPATEVSSGRSTHASEEGLNSESERQLIGYRYDGFWASMDTFKDKQQLESLWRSGAAPWEVWKANDNSSRKGHGNG
jgi:NDP-sugar pyrophosphorylase family protein